MKKYIIPTILFLLITVNGYWTNRLIKFAKDSSEYYKYLDLKTDCSQAKIGMDSNDIYLAAQGLTRKDLKGTDREILPERTTYDVQDEKCAKYAYFMCWEINSKDPTNIDHCHKTLLDMGYTDAQIEQVKKNKSFKGIEPK